jgi:hypothetical protein
MMAVYTFNPAVITEKELGVLAPALSFAWNQKWGACARFLLQAAARSKNRFLGVKLIQSKLPAIR